MIASYIYKPLWQLLFYVCISVSANVTYASVMSDFDRQKIFICLVCLEDERERA